MELTKEDIDEINDQCPSDQGIFTEPYGIPVHIKEPVIYMRWETGGKKGGNCWGDKSSHYEGDPKPQFKALDLVLKKLKPDLTYLQYREIECLVHSNEEIEWEYYGNSTDYGIEYIILDELLNLLDRLNDIP